MKDFLKLIFFGISKSPKLKMFNPDTGEKIEMTAGFNWQVLLLGSFFGLPLFYKRLWGWAWGLFVLSTVQFTFMYQRIQSVLSARTVEEYEAAMQKASDPVDDAVSYLLIAVLVLLAFKADKWAVERLLKKGWHFEDVSDSFVKTTVQKWKISKHFLKPPSERESL